MGFDDLINKGKEFASSEQGKKYAEQGKEAYTEFNKTEGTYTDKAKAAYSEFSKGSSSDSKDSKKESKD